jgi:transketolase
MSAIMKLPVVHVMSHDSIGLGEDGPTHQPVEHVPSLRLIPRLNVWRPADTVETMVAWHESVKSKDSPSVMVLTRQGLEPVVDTVEKAKSVRKGGYLLRECADAKATIVATGSEIELAIKVSEEYNKSGININVVSVPCADIFDKQSAEYIKSVIKDELPAVFVEMAQADAWHKYMPKAGGEVKGMTTFGESAPANELFEYFGFTVDALSKTLAKYV